jgi:hypothetical protein
MPKQTGGGILEILQVNWIYVLAGLVGVVVLYWFLSHSSLAPKVKGGMGCSKCPKASGQTGPV